MAKAKKEVKKEASKPKKFAITKDNGKVIYRDDISDLKKARLKKKGWKLEEV